MKAPEPVKQQRDPSPDSSEFEDDDDDRVQQHPQPSSSNWEEDPTAIVWDEPKSQEPEQPVPVAPASATQTFKCTALYSYTVSIFIYFIF